MLDERVDVGGIKASAARGDLVKELAEGHFVEVGGGVFQQEDPDFFDDCLEEEAAETLDSFDEFLPFKLGRIEDLGFETDGVRGVDLDGWVVRWKRNDEAVKGVTSFLCRWTGEGW